jgi:hypothetical protein
MAAIKIIAVTQEHRGHGVSTATYFLGQALAHRQIPVLLIDVTERHARLPLLNKHFPTRNLVVLTPPAPALRDLHGMLNKARAEVAGHAACLLLDIDLTALDTLANGDGDLRIIDYLLLATDHTPEGERTANQFVGRFAPLHEYRRYGAAFARIAADAVPDLPEETNAGVPILGYWPADYRLAAMDDFAAAGTPFPEPNQAYFDAMGLLATRLARLTPLTKLS